MKTYNTRPWGLGTREIKDIGVRSLLRLASTKKICPACGLSKRLQPDQDVCTSCTEAGLGPADMIGGQDFGWRR